MLHTTRAVGLRTFRHGDSTLVLKAYTELFGARSYLVRAGRKSAAQAARLQPMARLELVVTEQGGRDLQYVREMQVWRPYTNLQSDPMRGLVLLFAQEVFYRTLREEAPDPALFAFVLEALEAIDTTGGLAEQPLQLLLGLAGHLGFRPGRATAPGQRFDLREGQFFSGEPAHAFCLNAQDSQALEQLLRSGAGTPAYPMQAAQRRAMLEHLLQYFRLHVEGFGELRSPAVLHDLLK